jgi:hypothetical protein
MVASDPPGDCQVGAGETKCTETTRESNSRTAGLHAVGTTLYHTSPALTSIGPSVSP